MELQAFPSVFAFQIVLSELYRSTYQLDGSLGYLLGGHSETSFWKLMERVIVHGHDPENVVLTEVEPRKQKTLPDFLLTADGSASKSLISRNWCPRSATVSRSVSLPQRQKTRPDPPHL